jgi:hypothetical protein
MEGSIVLVLVLEGNRLKHPSRITRPGAFESQRSTAYLGEPQ